MVRVWLVVGFVALVFWVFAIVDCAVQPATRHRGVRKAAWVAIVVLIPVLGGILWFTIGRARRRPPIAYRAPDDDPRFLDNISAQDERIRRLEEELARLDDEVYPDLDLVDDPSDADDEERPPTAPQSER